MKPCTLGKRHKWTHIKNVRFGSIGLRTASFSLKGLYRCECGEEKTGKSRPMLEGAEA
jgi:hypothetical protein